MSTKNTIEAAVVVIGSGPAGYAAAVTCANAGLATIIVTANNLPAAIAGKTWRAAETIHPGVLSVLEKLAAADCAAFASRGKYTGVQTGTVITPLGADEHGEWTGDHIDRDVFDAGLLQAAFDRGIHTITNEKVTDLLIEQDWVCGVKTMTGKTVRAAYVIDASGQQRIAGKQLLLDEQYRSPALVAWTGLAEGLKDDHPLFHQSYTQFIPAEKGWTWLAPENNGRCSWTRLAVKGEQDLLPPPSLADYTDASAIKVSNRRWRIFRPVCKEGILLCGDAAGILDPAAGQGILNALWSGSMAGETVVNCINDSSNEAVHLAKYDQWFIEQYEDKCKKLKEYYHLHNIQLV